MRASGCGCAPVVEDTNTRKLVGVVTERDLCHAVTADDRRASEVRVEEVMRPAVSACCGMEDSLEEAAQKLSEQQATSLPVVNKAGSCCGTISQHDLRQK